MRKLFLLLTAVLTTTMLHAETITGKCGENMSWEFNTSTGELLLIGSGPMDDYDSFDETPWAQYQMQITSIQKDSRSEYTTIGGYAFSKCKKLTSVDLPNTVTDIKEFAFSVCIAMTSITMSSSLINIEEWAFYYCEGLTSITIPVNVKSIGMGAFSGCCGLQTIIIPGSVKTIGNGAFSSCAKLTSIHVSAINTNYSAVGGVLYNKDKTILYQFPAGKTGSFDIPNTVTEILGSAFEGCSGLTAITIPNSVTSIGDHAFYWCTALTSVTIPNSVTSIGDYAFSRCSSLTSPVYNTHVFAYMPTSYSGAYTIPDGIESIAGFAFSGCSGLTSVIIPNSVTSIGDGAFEGCSGLTSVTIPNSVTSIGEDAFNGCTGLTAITIPNSVTSIGKMAFAGCSGLTTITCKAVNPPTLGDDVFYKVDETIPLYVPAQSVEAYQNADGWNDFKNNTYPIHDEAFEQVQSDKGQSTKALRNGILYIERGGKMYSVTGQEVK